MNAADTTTIAIAWAKGLNDEQLAARLNEYAKDIRWGPMPQRIALFHEAAARIFDGTPKIAKAPLPTKAALGLGAAQTEPAESRNDEADHALPTTSTAGTGRVSSAERKAAQLAADQIKADTSRAAKTGHPAADRKAGSIRELEARATAEEECPNCGAQPGATCTRTVKGKTTALRHPHAERAAALGKRLGAEAQAEIEGGQS